MMRSPPSRSQVGVVVALALLWTTGCWEIVGVEDRRLAADEQEDEVVPASACPLVSVESPEPVCAACLQANCCAELLACSESAACRACLFPGDAACTAPPEHEDLKSCVRGPCADPCLEPDFAIEKPFCNLISPVLADGECVSIGGYFGRFECNPVNNQPCIHGEETCALDEGLLIWTCRASGHALPACAACGFAEGECAPGHVCANGECYRYCCTDEDCGAPATGAACRKPLPGIDGGLCVIPSD